jgi:hypothetical protein
MPASSSEKRARQRANKLKSSASSVQAPEIIPLHQQVGNLLVHFSALFQLVEYCNKSKS